MVILISGTNLEDILRINPDHDGGLYVRELSPGVATFRSVETDVVYTYHAFTGGTDQLNVKALSSPKLGLRLLSEFSKHMLTENARDIEIPWRNSTISQLDGPCTIVLPYVYSSNTWPRMFERYFNVEVDEIYPHTYSIELKADTLVEGYSTLSFLLLMLAASNDTDTLHEDQVIRYINLYKNKKFPYFMIYLMSHRLIRSPRIFQTYKEILENMCEVPVTLVQGNTHDLRIQFVKNLLDKEKDVLDFGCGELRYAKSLKNFKGTYYAYDIEDITEEVEYVKKSRGINIVETNLDAVYEKPLQIICSEVIEHVEDPIEVLNYFKTLPFEILIITTPMVEFNTHYLIDGPRREDHLREYTKEEFRGLINELFSEYTIEFGGIGDTINDTNPSQYATIKPVRKED